MKESSNLLREFLSNQPPIFKQRVITSVSQFKRHILQSIEKGKKNQLASFLNSKGNPSKILSESKALFKNFFFLFVNTSRIRNAPAFYLCILDKKSGFCMSNIFVRVLSFFLAVLRILFRFFFCLCCRKVVESLGQKLRSFAVCLCFFLFIRMKFYFQVISDEEDKDFSGLFFGT